MTNIMNEGKTAYRAKYGLADACRDFGAIIPWLWCDDSTFLWCPEREIRGIRR
jgi:hypothetical protein